LLLKPSAISLRCLPDVGASSDIADLPQASNPTEDCAGTIPFLNFLIEHPRHQTTTYIFIIPRDPADEPQVCASVRDFVIQNLTSVFKILLDDPPVLKKPEASYKKLFAGTPMPAFEGSDLRAALVLAFSPSILRPREEMVKIRDRLVSASGTNGKCGDVVRMSWKNILSANI
jgi:hypothetical protein